jgi:hypothetical protein
MAIWCELENFYSWVQHLSSNAKFSGCQIALISFVTFQIYTELVEVSRKKSKF